MAGNNKERFLGSFLSKSLKTNQLEVNTDEKTLRPIARLKEPRDLFALPKDKEHDCPQQAPRWPIECQVIEDRIHHIPYVPEKPEPYNAPTGSELKPRPVGEENGYVVFNYNPISAVNYEEHKLKAKPCDSSDSDMSSSESQNSSPEECSTPDRRKLQLKNSFSKFLQKLEDSDDDDYEDDDEDDDDDDDDDEDDEDEDDDENACWKSCRRMKHTEKVEIDNILKKKFITPVRFDTDQLARINTLLTRSSSSSSSSSNSSLNRNSDSDTDGSKTLRANDTIHDLAKSKLTERNGKGQQKQNWKQKSSTMTKAGNHVYEIVAREKGGEDAATDGSAAGTDAGAAVTNSASDNPKTDSSCRPLLQFSRSAVGGSKMLSNCHPSNLDEINALEFESRFESGNLAKAVMITPTYYELYLRSDLYTSRSRQWFYFRVRKTKKNMIYRFSIVNLVKSDSLYNEGMRPLMYSSTNAKKSSIGWRRCGDNICYYRNEDESSSEDEEDNASYTLTFNVEFPHDNDTVFFAHSYPYTYSELQDYLMEIQKNPIKSKFCKLRLLCRTLAGNNVYYLTVTAPTAEEDQTKKKKSIVVSARVHPSETPSSWMMKGLMDFITGDSTVAKRLRHKFIFKLIPMLNPDGVIVGNTRNSLTGKDLNRQYRTVIRETYPSIWYTKAMIKRLIDECGVTMYCDMHAHSRKHNIFIYGCENKRNPEKKLSEQVFPLMVHKNVADKFSFESCKFKIQRSKEGTGRIVVWMLGITNSYTIEASFGGSSLGLRKGTHFNTADYEHIGRAFCETLLDFADENPHKERLRLKIIERLLKEGSSAEEPLNIPLSDYTSDDGNCSSSSENEGRDSFSDLEGPCCDPLRAPPSTPENLRKNPSEMRALKFKRMRRIMRELDRIYFQPLFQKKCRHFMKMKQQRFKRQQRQRRAKAKQQMKTIEKSSSKSENDSDESEEEGTETPLQNEIRKRVARRKQNKKKKRLPDVVINKNKDDENRKKRTRPALINARRLKEEVKRIPLDMPSTDPGSEILFSTDDELGPSNKVGINDNGPLPTICRPLCQSDLQRRYLEEFSDHVQEPPEIIITSPGKSNVLAHNAKGRQKHLPRTAPPPNKLELGLMKAISERPSSWQSVSKTPVKWRNHHHQSNSPLDRRDTPDDLNFKLSVKKKIWTGVQPEPRTCVERNHPLSWSTALAATSTVNAPPPATSTAHSPYEEVANARKANLHEKMQTKKRDESEALLNACSQKLLALQKKDTAKPTVLCPNKKYGATVINLSDEETNARIFRRMTAMEPNATLKKKSLSKIAETTQMITRLNKTKPRYGLNKQRPVKSVPSTGHIRGQAGGGGQKIATDSKRFKTSGLAVTAVKVSQSNIIKDKKLRSINTGGSGDNQLLLDKRKNDPSGILELQPIVEKSNTFVRKVKNKLKKKSKTNVKAAASSSSSTQTVCGKSK